MMTMDVKGVPWVGGICQKFETLCVEVDETIYEDTVKYVGDQMQTVGETFKKFYSEVMQDLLAPSSLDSVKDNDTLVSASCDVDGLISANPNKGNETGSVDAASEGMVKESAADDANNTVNNGSRNVAGEQCTLKESLNQCTELVSSSLSCFVDKDFSRGRNSEHESLSDSSSISASVSKHFGEDSACSGAWNDLDETLIGADLICKEASGVEENQSKESREEITGDRMEGDAIAVLIRGRQTKIGPVGNASTKLDDAVSSMEGAVETAITSNLKNCLEFNEGTPFLDAGASNAWLAGIVENGGAHKQVVCLGEQYNNFKLEESCVLVENSDQFSESTVEDVQKSYKKKIREMFSSRRWSKSKKDQEQLAAWYEEQCGKHLISTSTRHDELQKSQTSETFESEWELL